ncbi:PAZ domain [Dillenia turbinata]|uniref:PAZ domain n=1 Tax=Dillenia turbinata TaxID=194707 RepID=A0AAN8V2D7_9MAGN
MVSGTEEMRACQISEPHTLPFHRRSKEDYLPLKQYCGDGAHDNQQVKLLANHFPVKYNPQTIIRHYDVEIQQEVQSKNGPLAKTLKSDLHRIWEELFSHAFDKFPLSKTAYDGERNLFGAIELPTGSFKLVLEDSTGTSYQESKTTFKVIIRHVADLKLCKLQDYLHGQVLKIPRDILQGLDIVMKENPARNMISMGRRFYQKATTPEDYLGHGITLSKGFQHSLKPTSQGLALCLDYSVLPFRKRMPVIDFLKENICQYVIKSFGSYRKEVVAALRGLKVRVIHRQTTRKSTIMGLSEKDARQITFDYQNPDGQGPSKQVFLLNYFKEKYSIDIVHKHLPCLDLGRKTYVPMELCILVEGQKYPSYSLDKKAAQRLKKESLVPPYARKNFISDMVQSRTGPCGGDVSQNFGIEVDTDMTMVSGHVIEPPVLKLGTLNGNSSKTIVRKDKYQWSLAHKLLAEGSSIERWAVLDFTAGEQFDKLNFDQFITNLWDACSELGIHIKDNPLHVPAQMQVFHDVYKLRELIKNVVDKACTGGDVQNLQILVCVLPWSGNGYKILKWICETEIGEIGLVTQCCLSYEVNRAKHPYFTNLALKINAKLGGSNFELFDCLPGFGKGDHVMLVGADVNHPAPGNATSPSIAAVVGSMNWPAANRYIVRLRPQAHRLEKILNFGKMCLELVENYASVNGVEPKKIVVFRDGVSESQSDMVLKEELGDLKSEFHKAFYFPTITLVVAQKRHHTRLFPDGEGGNVLPGTVVDRDIVQPSKSDFYLCSHYGSIGTSKPTHYQLLYDQNGFTLDSMQRLIYYSCFTFARCNKPVSLAPPVYYADLVAYRGRMYEEALVEVLLPVSDAASSSSESTSSSSSAALLDENSYKLHVDVKNVMFFI